MKLTISTETLKEMFSKAVKGVGGNVNFPISSFIAIKLENNQLTITTTDGSNYLYIKRDDVDGEDFYVVVDAEKITKLIGKQTCDKLTMKVTDNALEIKGDGIYKIEIPVDPATGDFIQYPNPISEIDLTKVDGKEISSADIKSVITACKASLATTLEEPCLTGYYFGERVVTTNNCIVTTMDEKLFSENVLLSAEYMNLLSLITSDKIISYIVDDTVVCVSSDCVVYGKSMDDIEEFPYDALNDIINQDMNSYCEIPKSNILATLDRIALFVEPYDNEAVTLTFTNDNLQIASIQSSGIETIDYLDNKDIVPFTCTVNIFGLIDEIKSYQSDTVLVYYGNDTTIKLVDGNTVFAIALMQDDESGEE